MNVSHKALVSGLTTALAASLCNAATVPFPYTQDFNSSNSLDNFSSNGGTWSLASNAYAYSSSSSASRASVQISGVPSTNNSTFTVASNVRLSTFRGATTNSVGLRFLAASDSSDANSYVADYVVSTGSDNGKIRIVRFPNSGNTITLSAVSSVLSTGVDYTFRVTGTYGNTGALSLTFDVLNASNTVVNTVSLASPDASPFTGNYFGYRTNIGSGANGSNLAGSFDNLTVIPEPSTLAGLAFVGVGMLRRRRG